MPSATPPNFLSANLAALRPWSPAVAALLDATSIPADWLATLGTDGTLTYSRPSPTRIDWLGGTSMPAASAVPLTANMNLNTNTDGTPGNGLGLGIGTGYEWRTLASRLGPQQMLFILEPDPVATRLALTICDLSELLASARLVIVLEPETNTSLSGNIPTIPSAAEQLLAFLDAHPGFEPPSVLHPLPTLRAAGRNGLIALGQAMIRQTMQRRADATIALANALLQSPPAPNPNALLAIADMQRRPWETSLPAALACVSERPVRVLALDRPDSASALVRLQALQAHAPQIVWAEVLRSQLNLPLAQDVAVHTWVPQAAGIGYWQAERFPFPSTSFPAQDRVIVHSYAHRRLLERLHVPPTQITLIPPAIRPQNGACPLPPPLPSGGRAFPSAIALIADLPSLDPEVYGLTLPSHVTLWQALRTLIAEAPLAHILDMQPDMVPDLLRRGQARANVTITDPALLESLGRGIEHVLLPAAATLGLARHLHEAGLPLKLIGRNFAPDGLPRATFAGMPADNDPGVLTELFADVAVALHFAPDATIHPLYLYAPLYNVPLVAPGHPWHMHAGTLPRLLRANSELLCPAAGQLIPALKATLRNAPSRQALAGAAAAHIASEHTWQKRVAGLLAQG